MKFFGIGMVLVLLGLQAMLARQTATSWREEVENKNLVIHILRSNNAELRKERDFLKQGCGGRQCKFLTDGYELCTTREEP